MMLSIILLRLKFIVYNQINPNSKEHTLSHPIQSTVSILLMEERNNEFLIQFPTYAHLLFEHEFILHFLDLLLILYFLTRKEASLLLILLPSCLIPVRLVVSLETYRPIYIISLFGLFTQSSYTRSRKAI